MKVNLKNREFNSRVIGTAVGTIGVVSSVISFFDFSVTFRFRMLCALIVLGVCYYCWLLYKANHLESLTLNYGESEIEIKQGDIFSEEYKKDNTFRTFAFNEYFDTKVDEEIISKNSLNGQFINREVPNISDLDEKMSNDLHLKNNISCVNKKRVVGDKHISYELGTIFKYSDNVFLTAMTYFDNENHAHLTVQEYQKFLIHFWDEINNLYNSQTVVIPLLGSGAVTRLDGNIYSSNQILEIVLFTFYLRRIKFRKPAHLVILLDQETNKKINYYKIRSMFNGLQK
ncbi:macro domain-containing protein [Lactiplantibacillus plantarum]|uniref:macro domain-containing protein n=1 Tax=Lactiplantibacillus plantarum TaxID=1590 RepID=UPI0015EB771B|nr:macro domain-containing protein [Lactiplantibacillus plantarum]QLQ49169.1 hypothetical protein H0E85_10640 [Lactiplantibacillus plantarum]WDQ19913.1 DUF6430 domain-containing protein [Lactiplantibacillus plantarum]BEI53967.1 hypothetical protein AWA2045_20980 [Lactiplantibacillus plantarum]